MRERKIGFGGHGCEEVDSANSVMISPMVALEERLSSQIVRQPRHHSLHNRGLWLPTQHGRSTSTQSSATLWRSYIRARSAW